MSRSEFICGLLQNGFFTDDFQELREAGYLRLAVPLGKRQRCAVKPDSASSDDRSKRWRSEVTGALTDPYDEVCPLERD